MSFMRRMTNSGRREREAKKRHRRARAWLSGMGAEAAPLKLGHKHFRRWIKRSLAVADSRKFGG